MRSIGLHLAILALVAALVAATFAPTARAAAAAGAAGGSGSAGSAGAAGGSGAAGSAGSAGSAGAAGGGAAGGGGSGGGGAPPWFGHPDGASQASCGGGLDLPQPAAYGDAGDAVKTLSRATERYLKQCECATQACVADALDQYAAALAVVAPRLPRQLRDMPNIVARAARRVRAARTKGAAVRALHEAIAIIHKDIALVRAEDSETSRRQTRSGDFVAETLSVASLSFEKGGGL